MSRSSLRRPHSSNVLAAAVVGALFAAGVLAGCSGAGEDAAMGEAQAVASTESDAPSLPSARAWKLFTTRALPELKAQCRSCHAAPAQNGRRLFEATDEATYARLDALLLVSIASADLVSPPYHAQIAGSESQRFEVRTWLEQEKQDRKGTLGDPEVFEKLKSCVTQDVVQAAGLPTLRSRLRPRESRNQVVGLGPCVQCHNGPLETDPAKEPDARAEMASFLVGLQGTALVPSPRLELYSAVTAAGELYSHPMFELNDATRAGLPAAVDLLRARYEAGTCAP